MLDTIYNRQLKSGKTACQVVAAPFQFSWYEGWWKRYTPDMKKMLDEAREHPQVLKDKNYRFFFSLTALDKPPYWAAKMTCTPIGNHAFCKENK